MIALLADARRVVYCTAPDGRRFVDLFQRAQALADPELLADAERASLAIAWRSGEELEQAVRDLLALPQPVLDRLRRLVI